MQSAFRSGFVCLAIAAGVMGTAATALAQPTVLVFDSQAGDYIGGGQRGTYTAAKSTFVASRNGRNGVSVSVIEPNYASYWFLDFGSAGDLPLALGSYRSAHRFPFTSFNGLDIHGSGRGCNTLDGRFDVREIVYADDGSVVRFAADFEQHCEEGAPALFGAIRYNSTILDAVPFGGRYPSYDLTISPAAGGVVMGESIDCGNGATSCSVSFRAPTYELLKAIPDAGYQLLEWTGDCQGGEVTSVHVKGSTICAPVFGPDAPASPRNALVLDSQTGDYIGFGRQLRYGNTTSVWSPQTRNGGNTVQFFVDGADGSWNSVEFRAPGDYTNRLVPGEYLGAKRASFSYPAPGLDVNGNGSGCNEIAGRFVVYESVYNPDGTIARFAADFEQHCEGLPPALFGSVRYKSTVAGVLPFGGAYPAFRVTSVVTVHGRVTGGGMDCWGFLSRCSATASSAGPITLTATPDSGYAFSGWTGDCSGTSPSTVVQVDASNKMCSARFTRTLVDSTAPALSRLPGNQRVLTASAAGVVVTWMPLAATDAVDGSVAVACAPASRTVFPVGDTMVTCSAMDLSGNQATTSFTVTVVRRALGADLNGDGQTDLLWRNPDGEIAVWTMNGQTRAGTSFLGTIPPHWRIAAAGDFTGDGNADLVWQEDTGTVALWEMQGTTHVATHFLYEGYTGWRVVAAADLNADGHVDLIWQGPEGNVAVWSMRRLVTASTTFLFDANTPWRVVAAGDLDGDGFADLVWQSPTGSVAAWLMNGLVQREVATLAGDTDWRIEGIVNLNGDNYADLVWQDPSGAVVAWLMEGAARLSVVRLYEGPTDWRISGPR